MLLHILIDLHFSGKIVASIPWTSLYSMPVVLTVEDVYVLAAPLNDGGYDPKRDAALQNAIKRKKLADLENTQAADSGEKKVQRRKRLV